MRMRSFFIITYLIVVLCRLEGLKKKPTIPDRGLWFPRFPISRKVLEEKVFTKPLLTLYRTANPPFPDLVATDVRFVLTPTGNGTFDLMADARFEGNCITSVERNTPVAAEKNRAVYEFNGTTPLTDNGIITSFFGSNVDDYLFVYGCFDRDAAVKTRRGRNKFCTGLYAVYFTVYEFPPDRVKWCAAEKDLRKNLRISFDNRFSDYVPEFGLCTEEELDDL